jgi:hypothetical protein
LNEDDDTEEGEEKPRTVITTNGHEHSSNVIPTTILVGAKRRKCNIAHKIHVEDKVKYNENHVLFFNETFFQFVDSSSSLLKHTRRSSNYLTNKKSQ